MKPSVSGTGTPVLVQSMRDPVTSGHALLTHKPTLCFTSNNFSMSHSGVPLPRPQLALLERGER